MIVDDLFKRVDENDELFTHLKKQFPQLRQRTRAQRDADRDQQLADRAAQAQAHKDALKNAPPKEPTKTMSYDDSVVAFNDKTKALGYKRLSEEEQLDELATAQRQAYAGNKADGTAWTGDELRNKFFPQQPAAVAPAGQTPEEIRKAKQAAAAALAQQQMNNPTAPAVEPTATQQPLPQFTTNLPPDATVSANPPEGPGGTYNKRTGQAKVGNVSQIRLDDLSPEAQQQIQQQLSTVAEALIRPVTELLQQAESKEDIQRIKQFVDQQFVKHGAVSESTFAQRNQLINYIKEHSHKMAH